MELQSKILKIKTDAGDRNLKNKEQSPSRLSKLKSSTKKSQKQLGSNAPMHLPIVNTTHLPPVNEPASGSLMSEGRKHLHNSRLGENGNIGGVGKSNFYASYHSKFPAGKTDVENADNVRKHGS